MHPLYTQASAIYKDILSVASEVRRSIGVGLEASVYRKALKRELELRDYSVRSGVPLNLSDEGKMIDLGVQADLVVDDCFVVEVKACEAALTDEDVREVRTCAKGTGAPMGIVLNYGATAGDFCRYGELE